MKMLKLTFAAMLLAGAAAQAAPPAPVQSPAQTPKAVQAPTQAPTQAPAKTAQSNSGYRTYSYEPSATSSNYSYGYSGNGYYRARQTGNAFHDAGYKIRGQW